MFVFVRLDGRLTPGLQTLDDTYEDLLQVYQDDTYEDLLQVYQDERTQMTYRSFHRMTRTLPPERF